MNLNQLARVMSCMDNPQGRNTDIIHTKIALHSLGKLLADASSLEAAEIFEALVRNGVKNNNKERE